MKKNALFAFNGDPMCFVHVLLNALDMHEKGFEVRVVIEGAAVQLVPELAGGASPFSGLYARAVKVGLIDCACRACSVKLGVAEDIEKAGLPLKGDMSGHPSMSLFMDQGYSVITF